MADLRVVKSEPLPSGELRVVSSEPLKKYDAKTRGAKMKGEPNPDPFGDGFMGTLATDMAAVGSIPYRVLDSVTGGQVWGQDPGELVGGAVSGAVNSVLSLPKDLYTDVSQGKWGKLGARAMELGIGGRSPQGRAAGVVARDAAEGAGEAFARSPKWKGKIATTPDAIQEAIARVKLRAQQRSNPAPTDVTYGAPRYVDTLPNSRNAPAWQYMAERTPGWDAAPDASSVPAWQLPSGRVPGMPQLPRGPDPIPPRAAPAWQSLPERTSGWDNPVEVTPVPATKLPSGRVPGKPMNRASAIEAPAQVADTAAVAAEVPAPSKPPFAGSAAVRETTARNISLAKAMHQGQMTVEMAQAMEGPHWKQLAEGMGLKVPNAESVKAIVSELKRLYAESSQPSPRGRITPPK